MEGLDAATIRRLQSLVTSTQLKRRLPSLVMVVQERGQQVGAFTAGLADLDSGLAAGSDVQYRIGSITKTLTAVAVMQLVEAGRLDLNDTLGQHWPKAPHPDLQVSALLSHTSGLQREPVGEVWETLVLPTRDELPQSAADARRLYPAGSWWHYSNLAYALLGEMVAQISGLSWEEYIHRRLLRPLGMNRTTLRPTSPRATGYAVSPYSDEVAEEPAVDSQGIAPAAQIWSTAADLGTWSNFLNCGHAEVLRSEVLQAMRAPRVLADLDGWRLAWGLGLMLMRSGDRVYHGHTGSMPGFLAACFSSPGHDSGVAVVTNSTASLRIGALAAEALNILTERDAGRTWMPGPPVPDTVRPLLGRWWSEWNEWVFSWREGALVSIPADAPEGADWERYQEVGPDLYLCASGPERGEELRIVRGEDGGVEKMYRATYPMTREPKPFGAAAADPQRS